MKHSHMVAMPEIWLLILIIVLPQLSETVYTPSLPSIAQFLHSSHALVEYTLTIFLFGLAVGTLFWGKLSDKIGRKLALILGLVLYGIGCIGCYYSSTITALLISRFAQAFGGSTGSVLGQVICRDAFHGPRRGAVFSVIGSSLALAPALGPVLGGSIAEIFGWQSIFLFLLFVSILILSLVIYRLPETYTPSSFSFKVIKDTALRMVTDYKIIGFGLLVALCNGISFSYFAEGSFLLINLLGLSPSIYGATFLLISVATMLGGYVSKTMNEQERNVWAIITYGSFVILYGALLYLVGMGILSLIQATSLCFISLILISISLMMFGIGIMIPNVLAIALLDYKEAIGTASSLFGFYYYCLISLCTLGMGLLHNHTLWPMPLYFFVMAVILKFVCYLLKNR
ncbi:MAG: Bcr/CflA family drug resistance efflux transporter [Epsilonproteobacteria bacterium]|nr:Bcr/CflA family drug resistance efflux transporter [Campylobacterota bacterium]